MDLNTVTEFVPADRTAWRAGDAWLGGGTWLFSQPQPGCQPAARPARVRLAAAAPRPTTAWSIAATCTLAELARWRPRGRTGPGGEPGPAVLRRAARLVQGAERGHGRRQHLPVAAGRADDLADRRARRDRHALRAPDGGTRRVPVAGFVTGDGANVLAPGELLTRDRPARRGAARADRVPAGLAVPARAGRPSSSSPAAAPAPGGQTVVTITAATAAPGPAPVRRAARARTTRWPRSTPPSRPRYLDDVHGGAPWRAAMTRRAWRGDRGAGGPWPGGPVTGARQRPPGRRRAAARPVPADVPARAGLARGEEGLRHRRLRRLHGARRRRAGAQLRVPGDAGGRPGGDHDRGPDPAPAAGRVPAPRRVSSAASARRG